MLNWIKSVILAIYSNRRHRTTLSSKEIENIRSDSRKSNAESQIEVKKVIEPTDIIDPE